MSAPHIPVLLAEVIAALRPAAGLRIIDGTFGAGGYSRAILSAAPCSVLGIDRDPTSIAAAAPMLAAHSGRLALAEGRFGALDEHAADHGWRSVDAVVLDIGVSSMQIDRAERGFSFQKDGPLDMRMAMDALLPPISLTPASEERLADIYVLLRRGAAARPIARAIVADRKRSPSPAPSSSPISRAASSIAKPGQIHPATRIFQALRIAVNEELEELVDALHAAERILKPGGVLAVVTFHSLEDRIVKQFLAARFRQGGGSRYQPSR